MGGPILIMAREKQCIGAGPCIPRQLTEEERLKYASIKPLKKSPAYMLGEKFINTEVEEMKGIKISPPEKGKLVETLAEVQGKSNTLRHAAKIYFVSITTALKWVADYGIEFDSDGRVFQEPKKSEALSTHIAEEEAPNAVGDSITDDAEAIHAGKTIIPKGELSEEFLNGINNIKEDKERSGDTIHITGQETTKKHYKVGYAEYDIGKAFVQVDFRQEIVNFSTGMSFEETEAVIELLSEIL